MIERWHRSSHTWRCCTAPTGSCAPVATTAHKRRFAAGVRQLVLPFSTDQFSNGADPEHIGAASVLSPNEAPAAELALAIDVEIASALRAASAAADRVNVHLA